MHNQQGQFSQALPGVILAQQFTQAFLLHLLAALMSTSMHYAVQRSAASRLQKVSVTLCDSILSC